LNNLLLTAAAATVCTGTLYPLALETLTGAKISVGPPYFAVTFVPIMAALALIVPFGPLLKWRQSSFAEVFDALRAAVIAALAAFIVTIAFARPDSALGLAAIALGAWLIAGAATFVVQRRQSPSAWGAALAHAGLGVVALGVAGATVWKSEAIEVLGPGDSLSLSGYTLRLEKTERVPGPNYLADRATFALFANGRSLATMQPEKRTYPVEEQTISKTAIRTTGLADLYVALGDPRGDNRWVVRAYRNPLAPFIWFGAGVMALGGVFSLRVRMRAVRAQNQTALAHA
jgi:cytochrome c-type biogenesis protein CcmF